jgi:hypothetical protein
MQAAQQSAGQDSESSCGRAEPTAEQIREELVPLLLAAFQQRQKLQKRPPKGTSPAAPHNLAAITMLCMLSGYEERAIDFMPAMFAECPQQVRNRLHGQHVQGVSAGSNQGQHMHGCSTNMLACHYVYLAMPCGLYCGISKP